MANPDDPILQAIQAELAELDEQLAAYQTMVARKRQLEMTRDILSGNVSVAPDRTASRAESFRQATSKPRTRTSMSSDDRASAILELVQANPGQHSYKSLADALGVSPATATKAAQELMEQGKLTSQGQRRAFRLFPANPKA
jgi:hypothetical protein